MSAALLEAGYARARAATRRHSRSFFFASVALFGQRRRAAFALYAFCRQLDDLVDGDNRGDGSVAAPGGSAEELKARLALARAAVGALYGRAPPGLAAPLPWHEAEFAAFRDTVLRYRIPEAPFQALIDGMEMDLTRARYRSFDELHLYCHRVAGVVGEMMTPVLGYRDERCLPWAASLGVAMQLTNILRDVREDLARGRVYLPADELAAFGVTEEDLQQGRVTEAWRRFMRFQVERARAFYRRGALGIPDLSGFGSRRLVRLMGAVYGGILGDIEARGYDVFSGRPYVSFSRKLGLAVGVALTPNPSGRAASASVDLPTLTAGGAAP